MCKYISSFSDSVSDVFGGRARGWEFEQPQESVCIVGIAIVPCTPLSPSYCTPCQKSPPSKALPAQTSHRTTYRAVLRWFSVQLLVLQVENPIPLQSVIKLPDYLLTMSDTSTRLPTVCWNKALDILSQSLPYGDMVSPTTNVFSPQVTETFEQKK